MQIQVNKESWHYPSSVCPYFWRFIFNNLFAVFASIVISGAVVAVVAMLTAPIWSVIGYYMGYLSLAVVQVTYGGFGVIIAALLIGYIWEERDSIGDGIDNFTKEGFTGVCRGYFSSIKNKVCPTIKYVDHSAQVKEA
jgi:carbon starvation protein CstA